MTQRHVDGKVLRKGGKAHVVRGGGKAGEC